MDGAGGEDGRAIGGGTAACDERGSGPNVCMGATMGPRPPKEWAFLLLPFFPRLFFLPVLLRLLIAAPPHHLPTRS